MATGTSVIIAPGGGHRELWSDHEGHNVARWLSERGIAAFVLKYRLARETNSTYTVDDHTLADMQRAIRLMETGLVNPEHIISHRFPLTSIHDALKVMEGKERNKVMIHVQ